MQKGEALLLCLTLLIVTAQFIATPFVHADQNLQIRISGSDTELPLVQRIAEVYREIKGSDHVDISVTGGGSGVGIAALFEGRADIANSSRPLKKEEIETAQKKGLQIESLVLGQDALAVIVHEKNPLNEVEVATLGKIFRGEFKSWDQITAWQNSPQTKCPSITLYGRQSNSGTYDYFREAVLKGDYALTMLNMNGNAQIVQAVRQDRGGIGYVGVGFVVREQARRGLRVLKIIDPKTNHALNPLDPLEVKKYPISRPLFQFFKKGLFKPALNFLEFELQVEGQNQVRNEGFYELSDDERLQGIERLRELPNFAST